MQYWLVKTEPGAFSWEDLVNDGKTHWDGVRNYQARNNLKLMKKGDHVLLYHSVNQKQVMGIAKVSKEFYQDPTTDDERWVAVEIKPHKAFRKPITLAEIKAEPVLENIALVKHSRLSVMPLEQAEFDHLCAMGAGKL